MNKSQLSVFKIVLFVLGFAVIGAAFLIVNLPFPEDGISAEKKFFWINLVAMYLVFFCPLFFSSISTKNLDEKIVPTVGVWTSGLVFEAAALVLSILVLAAVLSIKAAAVIELVLLFFCAVFVYFGYFSGNHISNVQAAEKKSISELSKVKSAFEILSLKSSSWKDDLYMQKEKIRKICDDVKYLSPVGSEAAADVEKNLSDKAAEISSSNLTASELDGKIGEIEILLRQRKTMRL